MVQGILVDRTREPDFETMSRAVGTSGRRWDELTAWLDAVGGRGTITWDGVRDGWSLHFRRAGRPLATLTPLEDSFQALVVLGRDQSVEAASVELSTLSRSTYDTAHQYPDGRWLFLHVASDEQLADVIRLLCLKVPPRVRARVAKGQGRGS